MSEVEKPLVIKRYWLYFKYPINLGIALLPVMNAVNTIVHKGYEKVKRNAKCEGLPEPRETKTAGLITIEFYGEAGLLNELDLDHALRLEMLKNRLLAPFVKRLSSVKALGIEYKFEELEEWTGV